MSALSEKERQEVSLLLPWYANGTLDSEDSCKVEAALAQDEALAREFDLVLEDQAATIELVSEEEVPISIAERFNSEVAWADIDAFLSENRGQVVKGPTADGLYELEFEKAEGLAAKMEAKTGIFEFVLPAN